MLDRFKSGGGAAKVPRIINGELVIEVVRATGCIDVGALKPSCYFLELTELTPERKTSSDVKKSKRYTLTGEVSTKVLEVNEVFLYQMKDINANSLPRNVYIRIFAMAPAEGFGGEA